jgi:hypothetical protein
MTLTIPNKAVTYPFQSRWFQADVETLARAAGGRYGVISDGCVPAASGVPAMTVEVESGQVVIDGVRYNVSAQTAAIPDADPLLPRFDSLVVDIAGVAGVLPGTPDAAPFPREAEVDQVYIAQIFIPEATTAIESEQVVDKRITVPDPIANLGWNRISASVDLQRSQQGTKTMDSVLAFPVAANTKYRVRGNVAWLQAVGGSQGMQWGIAGPLVPTLVIGVCSVWDIAFGGSQGITLPVMTGTSPVPTYNGTMSYPRLGSFSGADQKGTAAFEIIIQNGVNAGSFGVAWGQGVANANPITRLAGSYIEYEVV